MELNERYTNRPERAKEKDTGITCILLVTIETRWVDMKEPVAHGRSASFACLFGAADPPLSVCEPVSKPVSSGLCTPFGKSLTVCQDSITPDSHVIAVSPKITLLHGRRGTEGRRIQAERSHPRGIPEVRAHLASITPPPSTSLYAC